jgi:hypothetical protein
VTKPCAGDYVIGLLNRPKLRLAIFVGKARKVLAHPGKGFVPLYEARTSGASHPNTTPKVPGTCDQLENTRNTSSKSRPGTGAIPLAWTSHGIGRRRTTNSGTS